MILIPINLKQAIMTSRKEQSGQEQQNRPNRLETPSHGPQGVDKAPGEEPSQDDVQFMQQALKGKKVDRNPTQEKDEPLDKQDL
jgi:hypothetical protein